MKPLANKNHVWTGKAVGAGLGLVSGGPFGLVVGALVGHVFDRLAEKNRRVPSGQLQQEHISSLFRIMGYLAKVDGRVSEAEIESASQIMQRLKLSGEARQSAIRLFNEGKQRSYSLTSDLVPLQQYLPSNQSENVMGFLIEVAYADGRLKKEKRRVLIEICDTLEITRLRFFWLCHKVRQKGGWQSDNVFSSSGNNGSSANNSSTFKVSRELRRAYQALGLEPGASDSEIKQAYRRLVSEYHPDKLQARGATEAEIRQAKEKIQAIRSAYDLIRKYRQTR